MSGVMPLLPLYALMAWTGQTLPFFMFAFLTTIGLTPDDSDTVHIYTQTVHRIQRTNTHTNKKILEVKHLHSAYKTS
jgi:hypothetical protein